MKVWVTGGFFDEPGDGATWRVDFGEERSERVVRWDPPEHLRVSGKGFAGGSFAPDGTLYVAAHAAVARVDSRRGEVTGVLHQPCMNDLHHVRAERDRLWVSNTGLSSVEVFDLGGELRGSHALLPAWANARRLGGQDLPRDVSLVRPGWAGASPLPWASEADDDPYFANQRAEAPFHARKVRDYLHVNHVGALDGVPVATCFADGSLRSLATFEILDRLPGAFLHDGEEEAGALWLTAIDGRILRWSPGEGFVEHLRVFETGHHGWCRGLALTPEHFVIGLTEVRRGRMPRHRWADREPEGSETSVLLIDRSSGKLCARVEVGEGHRHAKIYSVLREVNR